jgi:23S rRNA (guanosine2251-2'-O)-methyltransferase
MASDNTRRPGFRHGRPPHRPHGHSADRSSRPHAASDETDDGRVILFGLHPVEAALANPARVVHALALTENAERRLATALGKRPVTIERVSPRDLDRRLGADTVHQGAMLETDQLPEMEVAEMARLADGRPLLVLDQVTDPHNVGAIVRSAAVFDAAGLIVTRRHSPPLNGTLAKSASGALELVPIARVQNLARSLEQLKDAGSTVIGLDGDGDVPLDEIEWPDHPVFVLGAEGKGLRHLTRETCSRVCRIATVGALASLNVSNAAAVALHLAAMHRRKKKSGSPS